MKLSGIYKSDNTIQLDKKTLVILRWIAFAGQFLTINFVFHILNFKFPYLYCSLIILLGILTNCYLQLYRV